MEKGMSEYKLVTVDWKDGYRAAMNEAGWAVRELYVNHVHHTGVDGLLKRCQELEQSFICSAEAAPQPAEQQPITCVGCEGAPTVQGEPVAWMTHHDEPMLFPSKSEAALYCDDEQPIPLYAAHQPAEQQPSPDVVELQAELERERKRRFDGNEQASREHRADLSALVGALEELIDLMEDTRQGGYTPDSFTTQPARIALAQHAKVVSRE